MQMIKTGAGYSISPQQIIDCDTTNTGCDGSGSVKKALAYLFANKQCLLEEYPIASDKSEK